MSRKIKKPLIDKDGEVRKLTAGDMKLFKPMAEVDPQLATMAGHARVGAKNTPARCQRQRLSTRHRS